MCAHVFVSVLPFCFLSAAYQLTMATNRALLTAAGLMIVVTAHCQSIIINLMLTQKGNGTISKRSSGDLSFPFLSLDEPLDLVADSLIMITNK